MSEHNLFNEYDPSLQYHSIFRYFQLPSNDLNDENQNKKLSSTEKLISSLIVFFMYFVVLITFPISGWFVIKKIKSLERCLIYRLGKRLPLKGPGVVLVMPCIDNFIKIDLNQKEITVVKNEPLLTSDGSLIEVQEFKAIISVSNAIKTITKIKDPQATVEKFIKLSFKNMISSTHVDDIEKKIEFIMMNFVTNININLSNWGWSFKTTNMPKIIIKNRYQPKNQVINLLKSYFDPKSNTTNNFKNETKDPNLNSFQLLKKIFHNTDDYKLIKEESCEDFTDKDKMIANLEKIAERYIHMNVFNYKFFNIHLVIQGKSLFFTYDSKKKFAIKKDKIENDTIHFTVNCKTMEDFQVFVDDNDTSRIEITTKLF